MPPTISKLREQAELLVSELRTDETEALAKVAQDAAEIVYLRIGEYLSYEEIADRLKVSVKTVEARLARARAAGVFSSADEVQNMMKNQLVPKAMDALNFHLNAKSEESAIATLKGAGVLVSHQRSQQQIEQNTTLRVVVENRDGSPVQQQIDPSTLPGEIVGRGHSDDEAPSIIRKNI